MKFSVLIPTRNRLEYLKYAVSSVLQQEYSHWELIISDNDSEEDVEGYIHSLNDSRIKYFRTASFCSVTENWNNAMEKSSGDYVVMLGDDDCLLKGYFSHLTNLIAQYEYPDMVYNGAFTYVYPAVIPSAPQGYLLKCVHASFFIGKKEPFLLDQAEAQELVNEIMDFNVAVNFNMQHSLVSQKLIRELQKYGAFYQSPYPDYYATTALLLKAKRILAVPSPMVVIGVTPKSFGCYYLNNREKEGIDFLKNAPKDPIYNSLSKQIIPGSEMNVFWLLAMESVKMNFSREFSLKVNYKKFRILQILHQCKKFVCREEVSFQTMISIAKNLSIWEKFLCFTSFSIAFFIRLYPVDAKKKDWASKMAYFYSHPAHGIPVLDSRQYGNIMEVFQRVTIDH